MIAALKLKQRAFERRFSDYRLTPHITQRKAAIALILFLELTAQLDDEVKSRVVRKMLTTASVTAVLLFVFGGLLTRLLHFSTGALAIAGWFILFAISTSMILSQNGKEGGQRAVTSTDPMKCSTECSVSALAQHITPRR